MANERDSSLFRPEALEQIASPEQLDQLMQVVNLKDWLPLASIGFLVALSLIWSVVGRIPVFVEAKGLLVQNATPPNPLISVSYFPIAEGKQIQPGDRILISPETANYQEFGGLEATVTEVSSLPVTQAAALKRANGNPELAALVYTPASIEVIAQLKPDPTTTSGYQWSMSKGPDEKLVSEIPTDTKVVLSERAPISFIFPFLK
ncbi:hypothetical protein IFO70_24440 [Phormidium tenue FACHB-886]|nr:hypothetical protein [Phormidium tenue FACHB-886]